MLSTSIATPFPAHPTFKKSWASRMNFASPSAARRRQTRTARHLCSLRSKLIPPIKRDEQTLQRKTESTHPGGADNTGGTVRPLVHLDPLPEKRPRKAYRGQSES